MPTSVLALEFRPAAKDKLFCNARALLVFYAVAATMLLLLIAGEVQLQLFAGLTGAEAVLHATGADLTPDELLGIL
jgi:hypothetical protein